MKDRLAIIAMPGHVLFKGIKSTIRINRALAESVYQRIKQDNNHAIVLLLKEGCNLDNYQEKIYTLLGV